MFLKKNNLNTINKNDANIEYLQLYASLNKIISYDETILLKELQSNMINPIYYQEYIDTWYKEWYSEINQDLSSKYKYKIEVLDIEYNKLLDCLQFNINK